jgi:hypothetical protein
MSENSSRFQFGLTSILVLTAISAGILAALRPLALPPRVYLGFAAYAILLTAYLVLRGCFLLRRFVQLRRQLRESRRDLSDWVEQRRQSRREHAAAAGSEPTSPQTDDGV